VALPPVAEAGPVAEPPQAAPAPAPEVVLQPDPGLVEQAAPELAPDPDQAKAEPEEAAKPRRKGWWSLGR
jgi:ribonuclease E